MGLQVTCSIQLVQIACSMDFETEDGGPRERGGRQGKMLVSHCASPSITACEPERASATTTQSSCKLEGQRCGGAGWGGGGVPKWLDTTLTSPQSAVIASLVVDVSSWLKAA